VPAKSTVHTAQERSTGRTLKDWDGTDSSYRPSFFDTNILLADEKIEEAEFLTANGFINMNPCEVYAD
jgi:hypothetical protein